MAEYIERRAALDALGVTKNATKYGGDHSGYDTMMLYEIHDALTGIPAADVVQVVHARWENYSPITIKCSRCGHVIQDWRYSECKYCPNCGAKMDARGEE